MSQSAARAGYPVSKSALWMLLKGKGTPRLETVEAFVIACANCARARRPPIFLSPADTDVARWRARYQAAYVRSGPSGSQLAPADSAGSGGLGREGAIQAMTCTLPVDTPFFTGRDDQVSAITQALNDAAEVGAGAVIAIDGMPGVGKTALALHAAHLLGEQFPDQRLFIDLHAHTPGQEPLRPEAALASLLAARGVDLHRIPEDLNARAALWRDQMVGQRALIVLDNALNSAQVTPLLLAGSGWAAVVTSRRYLGDLPTTAPPIRLEAMSPEQARRMFQRLVAPRAANETEAVDDLVRLCGDLPLAIGLLARVYNNHPSWLIGDLIAEARTRLLTVTAEKHSVAAAFGLSYRDLPVERQRLFRVLNMSPGAEFDAHAAAALSGSTLGEVIQHLEGLHAASLLSERGFRRYGMHDLIREYARALASADPPEDLDQALDRLMGHYGRTAVLADPQLARQTRPGASPGRPLDHAVPPVPVPALPDRGSALAWARAERANLLACVDEAARRGWDRQVVELSAGLASLLLLDGPWAEAVTLHTAAAAAARRTGDRLAEANALHDLGTTWFVSGDELRAEQPLEQALLIYRALGDRLGEANALYTTGGVWRMRGDLARSVTVLEQALLTYRELGDQLGEANTLWSLGHTQGRLTDDPAAMAALLEQALPLYVALGNEQGEARTLLMLADARQATGDYSNVAALLQRTHRLYRGMGDSLGEAHALTVLGDNNRLTGDYPMAVANLQRAIGLYRDIGARASLASATRSLSAVYAATGSSKEAEALLDQALAIFRDVGDPVCEAEVLNDRGRLRLDAGELDSAKSDLARALDVARAYGGRREQARALEATGRCHLAAGDRLAATTTLRQALEIYQHLGAAEVAELTEDLQRLTGPGDQIR